MDNPIKPPSVRPINLEDEMKKSFISYAMATIISRALPDVRDGLKPVHRRILHGMRELGVTPDKPFRKSARIVGDVMGKYHPHGDSSIYDAMVRMAQDFSIRVPLVQGHGNFGSMDGDGAAAMRYTEARLSRAAMELLRDIDKETVDFIPNFDETETQPSVMPARFPNLLVNGSGGIAVGMATNIPPHNLKEAIDATCAMIDDPDVSIETLMQLMPGPDFPTGGLIMGRSGILRSYTTGQGRVIMRAKTHFEDMGSGRTRIVITEMPYQVNKARVVEKIANLVHEKKVEGISDIRDESDRNGVRVVIELKRDINAGVVLNYLYKRTQLQETFGVNMLALVDGMPRVLPLREVLRHYIDHQREVVTRRTQFDLNKAQARAHVLEGLLRALDLIDAIIALIRASRTGAQAKAALMEQFGFTDIQAQAILDLRLQRLTGLERDRLLEEYQALQDLIRDLQDILASPERLMAVIRTELTEIADKYSNPRRTQITANTDDIDDEDLIQEDEMVVTMTRMGYIKRLPSDTYKQQNRGGVGIAGATTREDDLLKHILVTSTHDWLLFFTNLGRVFKLKCYQIPQAGRTARGTAVINLLQLEPGEAVNTIIPVPPSLVGSDQYLAMVTRRGTIKRTHMDEFANIRTNGLKAINLAPEDQLIEVLLTCGNDDIIIGTRHGQALRFHETRARQMLRAAGGVRGIRLRAGDAVVGATIVDDDKQLLLVTANGCGKRTAFDEFEPKGRGGLGVRALRVTQKTGPVVALLNVDDTQDLIMISSDGTVIRIDAWAVSQLSRTAQGVRIMRLRQGDTLVAVEMLAKSDSDDQDIERADVPQDEGEFDDPADDIDPEEPDDAPEDEDEQDDDQA